MTAAERLARELRDVWIGQPPDDWNSCSRDTQGYWIRLARHVLARERRARGRTVGYVKLGPGRFSIRRAFDRRPDPADVAGGCRVARVVLIPQKGGKYV